MLARLSFTKLFLKGYLGTLLDLLSKWWMMALMSMPPLSFVVTALTGVNNSHFLLINIQHELLGESNNGPFYFTFVQLWCWWLSMVICINQCCLALKFTPNHLAYLEVITQTKWKWSFWPVINECVGMTCSCFFPCHILVLGEGFLFSFMHLDCFNCLLALSIIWCSIICHFELYFK